MKVKYPISLMLLSQSNRNELYFIPLVDVINLHTIVMWFLVTLRLFKVHSTKNGHAMQRKRLKHFSCYKNVPCLFFYNCPEHLRTFEDNFISTCPALIAACWFVHVNTTFMVEMVLGRQLLGFTVLYLVLFQFCSTDPGWGSPSFFNKINTDELGQQLHWDEEWTQF